METDHTFKLGHKHYNVKSKKKAQNSSVNKNT